MIIRMLLMLSALSVSFNGNLLLDEYFNYCETFKLIFDDNNNLINIENIKFDSALYFGNK